MITMEARLNTIALARLIARGEQPEAVAETDGVQLRMAAPEDDFGNKVYDGRILVGLFIPERSIFERVDTVPECVVDVMADLSRKHGF
jgi:hypothetical protein